MKSSTKLGIIIVTIIGFIASMVLFINKFTQYTFVVLAITMVIVVLLALFGSNSMTPEESYHEFLKKILKVFNRILVKSETIPDIKNKTIIVLSNIDDLVDVQIEVRKPIYYIRDIDACDFVLLNENEVCTFTLKVSGDITSPLEKLIKEYEKVDPKKKDTSILEGLEKTTIIKISNGASYKVSPLKDKDIREAKDRALLESIREEYFPKLKKDTKKNK